MKDDKKPSGINKYHQPTGIIRNQRLRELIKKREEKLDEEVVENIGKEKFGMTPKQKKVYDFLIAYRKTYGVYPSTAEIAAGEIDGRQILPKRHKSACWAIMTRLKQRGYIEVLPYTERGLRVL